MIHRVFAFQDIPSRGVFEHPELGTVRADMLKFSRAKAILDTKVYIDKDTVLPVTLELPQEVCLDLEATVVDSGQHALFLRWNHADEDAEAFLATALVNAASWMLEQVEAMPLLAGMPGSGFDTPVPRKQSQERAQAGGDPESTSSTEPSHDSQPDSEEPQPQLENLYRSPR